MPDVPEIALHKRPFSPHLRERESLSRWERHLEHVQQPALLNAAESATLAIKNEAVECRKKSRRPHTSRSVGPEPASASQALICGCALAANCLLPCRGAFQLDVAGLAWPLGDGRRAAHRHAHAMQCACSGLTVGAQCTCYMLCMHMHMHMHMHMRMHTCSANAMHMLHRWETAE